MLAQLHEPTTDVAEILRVESALVFPKFSSDTAWDLGSHIRRRIPEWLPDAPPAVVHICTANTGNVLFHAVTKPASPGAVGVAPDNDVWVARKKAYVLRWNKSTYSAFHTFKGDQEAFADKFMLAGDQKSEFTIFGGGVPVRVANVEGIVGIVIVSGLPHKYDHQCVVQGIEEFLETQQ